MSLTAAWPPSQKCADRIAFPGACSWQGKSLWAACSAHSEDLLYSCHPPAKTLRTSDAFTTEDSWLLPTASLFLHLWPWTLPQCVKHPCWGGGVGWAWWSIPGDLSTGNVVTYVFPLIVTWGAPWCPVRTNHACALWCLKLKICMAHLPNLNTTIHTGFGILYKWVGHLPASSVLLQDCRSAPSCICNESKDCFPCEQQTSVQALRATCWSGRATGLLLSWTPRDMQAACELNVGKMGEVRPVPAVIATTSASIYCHLPAYRCFQNNHVIAWAQAVWLSTHCNGCSSLPLHHLQRPHNKDISMQPSERLRFALGHCLQNTCPWRRHANTAF